MNCLKIIFALGSLMASMNILAQTETGILPNALEDGMERSVEQINESGQNEIPEELAELVNQTIDINGDIEILVRYNLLTNQQLNTLIEYRKSSGNLVEIEELQQVDGFDKKTILILKNICSTRKIKYEAPSHQFTTRYQKKNSLETEDYEGANEKYLIRYKGRISPALSFGYIGEMDAGEKFLSHETKGFDYNSFHLVYNGKSILKKVIVGDYNVEFGQGLTAWSGLSFTGGSGVTGVYKIGRGLLPHTGTDENKFLRGLAASLERRKFKWDSWISQHGIDANRIYDPLTGESSITSLQTSGYHRTQPELDDKHSVKETIVGSSLNYSSGRLTTGIVALYQEFSLPVSNNDQPYKQFEFAGNKNLNAGFNYTFSGKNIILFGENSYCRNNTFAFLNGAILSIDQRLAICFLNRNYSKEYWNFKSNAFGTNSSNINETGNYIGINYKVLKQINYSAHYDIYKFPFLKYRVDQPTFGYVNSHQIEYTPAKKFSAIIRLTNKQKQINDSGEGVMHSVSNYSIQNLRFSVRFRIDDRWDYGFRAEHSVSKTNEAVAVKGTIISQDLFFHPMGRPYSGNIRYAIYNCPDFESRIYQYENDVQGAFSIPFYYGTGSRFYINLNFRIWSSMTLSLRYSKTWAEATSPPGDSEIKIQLKLNLR